MKAGLTVGGVHLALSTPARGPLERLVGSRYRHFLGAIENAVCWVALEVRDKRANGPHERSIAARDGAVAVDDPLFDGEIAPGGRARLSVTPTVEAVDAALALVLAVNGPQCGTLLLRGAAVVSQGVGHLLLGRGARSALRTARRERHPVLGHLVVAVRVDGDRCALHATPITSEPCGRDGAAPLLVTWMGKPGIERVEPVTPAQAAGWMLEHALLPVTSGDALDAALGVAVDIAHHGTAAACIDFGVESGWQRLDALGAAVGYQKILSIEQPALRSGLLNGLSMSGAAS